ncbi:hypothetical protein [Shewanella waksmanii]|uniref:hypothetical protein n=1 Tax=Shewanella waksmanii TaxID=213783 RepID=UPI0037353B08
MDATVERTWMCSKRPEKASAHTPLEAKHQSSVISHQSSVISHQSSVISHQSSAK